MSYQVSSGTKHTHMCLCTPLCLSRCLLRHTHTHTHTCVCVPRYVCHGVCWDTHTHTHTHVFVYPVMFVTVCVETHTHTHTECIYTCRALTPVWECTAIVACHLGMHGAIRVPWLKWSNLSLKLVLTRYFFYTNVNLEISVCKKYFSM